MDFNRKNTCFTFQEKLVFSKKLNAVVNAGE